MLTLSRLGGINFAFCNGHSLLPRGHLKEFLLLDGHFASALLCALMFVSDQMKNSVDHQEDDHLHRIETKPSGLALSGFNGNDQVSQKVRMEGSVFTLSHWKSEDIGGLVPLKVPTIEFPYLSIIDQQDAQFAIRKCQVGQYPLARFSYLSWV